jgi:hypothetical protein
VGKPGPLGALPAPGAGGCALGAGPDTGRGSVLTALVGGHVISVEFLDDMRKVAGSSTPGPTELNVCASGMDPVEWYQKCLAFSESPAIWSVGTERGEIIAITGNGPTSENNARFICEARDWVLLLVEEVRELQERLGVM